MAAGQRVDGREADLVRLQETLYSSRNPTRRWLHVSRRNWIIARLGELAASGRSDRALEVGPGSGVYLPRLASLYTEVVASDIERAYLEHVEGLATNHPNLVLAVDDVNRTGLEPGSFDLVLCSEVIEHINDSQSALVSMRRLLREGGKLLMTTPQRWSPLEVLGRVAFAPGIIQLVRLIYREPILKTGHVNVLTAEEARRQLGAAGFEIVASHVAGLYLPLVAEFGGETGLRLERSLERRLRAGRLSGLLWTQFYIARA